MTAETRELIARALLRAADAWEKDCGKSSGMDWSEDAKRQTERDACFLRGFAEALENGCHRKGAPQ